LIRTVGVQFEQMVGASFFYPALFIRQTGLNRICLPFLLPSSPFMIDAQTAKTQARGAGQETDGQ
jgi:hypothetical protein